jgi:hypothetical protein
MVAEDLYFVVGLECGNVAVHRPIQFAKNGRSCVETLVSAAYSTALGHLFHMHVASHSMTFGHPRELLCEAVYSCRNFAA